MYLCIHACMRACVLQWPIDNMLLWMVMILHRLSKSSPGSKAICLRELHSFASEIKSPSPLDQGLQTISIGHPNYVFFFLNGIIMYSLKNINSKVRLLQNKWKGGKKVLGSCIITVHLFLLFRCKMCKHMLFFNFI